MFWFPNFSFVDYSSEAEAEAAVEQFNNHEIEGRRIRVQMDEDTRSGGGNASQSSGGFTFGSSTNGDSSSQVKSKKIKITFWPSAATEVSLTDSV